MGEAELRTSCRMTSAPFTSFTSSRTKAPLLSPSCVFLCACIAINICHAMAQSQDLWEDMPSVMVPISPGQHYANFQRAQGPALMHAGESLEAYIGCVG